MGADEQEQALRMRKSPTKSMPGSTRVCRTIWRTTCLSNISRLKATNTEQVQALEDVKDITNKEYAVSTEFVDRIGGAKAHRGCGGGRGEGG